MEAVGINKIYRIVNINKIYRKKKYMTDRFYNIDLYKYITL